VPDDCKYDGSGNAEPSKRLTTEIARTGCTASSQTLSVRSLALHGKVNNNFTRLVRNSKKKAIMIDNSHPPQYVYAAIIPIVVEKEIM
jgi:thymidylate kinase